MNYLWALLATAGAIAIGAGGLALIDKWLPEAPPLGLTGRALPPGSVLPPTGKDGLHRPSGNLEPRTRGRLIAWSGSVRRAP